MPRCIPLATCLFLALAGLNGVAGADQPEKGKPPLRFWKDVPNRGEVVAATFLGGEGHEWLVGGGFQPDGSIVLAGNVRGPVFGMPVAAKVIGTEGDSPAVPGPVPLLERGKQKTDRGGAAVWEQPSWRHDGVTGFVVHCTADLKKVVAVHRLPWVSAALTSAAVGPDGAIYLAGRATPGLDKLGGDVRELKASAEAVRKDGPCSHAFVARLTADGAKAEWVRHSRGLCDAPQVAVRPDGSIRFAAQDVRTFDKTGKLLQTIVVPGGVRKTTSVSPVDGSIVVGGEHHWPTGREPWRCPTLTVHAPDGTLRTQLYDWGGPYVGLDNCRQVSDTAVRRVTHEPDGSILLYAWSDGGNSVMTTQPADVRRTVGPKGLGITTAGAGVLSCAYVVRIEPKNYTVTAWTLWLSFAPSGKPNSVWIDNLARVADGSIALAGRSAWGLWQTKNRLTDAEPTGAYVAVLDPSLTGVRYCSIVPGAGVAEVSYPNNAWGIATGRVNGKTRVLFAGSATRGADGTDTPTRNALQRTFGGGWCDGYALLLDLPASPPGAVPEPPPEPAPGPTTASFEKGAAARVPKNAPPRPESDVVFHFRPDHPRWVTVDAEFRDRTGKTWPSFLYGKPVAGTLAWRDEQLSADVTVACTSACQPNGEQGRRVLGDLFKENKTPELRLTLRSLGRPKSADLTEPGKSGEGATRTVEYREAKGVLELGGKKVEVAPKLTCRFSGPNKGPVDRVELTAWVTLAAGDLGLRSPGRGAEIDLRVSTIGTASREVPPKKPSGKYDPRPAR